uniref:B30.2/SPRY domain-containing protein n=1 Tax=Panagrolaimus sp. JU765 TaxID=591449 RepID=A0AC34RFM2_9BILA
MDDIPMADASDTEGQSNPFIRHVLTDPMSLDSQYRSDSSEDSSAFASVAMSYSSSCACSSDPEPEFLSAEVLNPRYLRAYYPNVYITPSDFPSFWSLTDRHSNLFVSPDRRTVRYLGRGTDHNDASAVRANSLIPRGCGVYYFEVQIISEEPKSLLGIGICDKSVPLNRLPGWDTHSYGYHGDDGLFFACCGKGSSYGPTFGSGDTVGCGINFATRKMFFTKNGVHLGYTDLEIPLDLEYYPVIGMQAQHEVATANFGQAPYVFDLIEEQKKAAAVTRESFDKLELPSEKVLWMNGALSNWLNHVGYSKTAEAFSKSINMDMLGTKESMERRLDYVRAIRDAKLVLVIDKMEKEFAELFKTNKELLLLLKLQRFIDRNYWSQKVINGEIPPPVPLETNGTSSKMMSRLGPSSSRRKRRSSGSENPDNRVRRTSNRNVATNNGEAMDISNGHSQTKNGCGTTTTIIAERQESSDSADADTEMQDLSSKPRRELFDEEIRGIYRKYYEPTINDARQIMTFMKQIGPISKEMHDLVMRTLDMLSCNMEALREEHADLISQEHRDRVAEAFNRCLIEYDGLPSSRTPIIEIIATIHNMSAELAKNSVGGTQYTKVDQIIFRDSSDSSSESSSGEEETSDEDDDDDDDDEELESEDSSDENSQESDE